MIQVSKPRGSNLIQFALSDCWVGFHLQWLSRTLHVSEPINLDTLMTSFEKSLMLQTPLDLYFDLQVLMCSGSLGFPGLPFAAGFFMVGEAGPLGSDKAAAGRFFGVALGILGFFFGVALAFTSVFLGLFGVLPFAFGFALGSGLASMWASSSDNASTASRATITGVWKKRSHNLWSKKTPKCLSHAECKCLFHWCYRFSRSELNCHHMHKRKLMIRYKTLSGLSWQLSRSECRHLRIQLKLIPGVWQPRHCV